MKSPSYFRLPRSRDSLENTDSDAGEAFIEKASTRRERGYYPPLWLFLLQFFVCLVSTSFAIFAYLRTPSDAECTRVLAPYSPALDAVEYHEENFAGIFHQPSKYRGTPTPELEAEWQKLWDYGGFNVPEDKLRHLNKSTERTWQRTPAEFGGGIAAMMWGFHQLHCLNIIRQATYKDVYERDFDAMPPMFDGPDYLVRMHLDHCIELIRIDMMCAADTTPYLVLQDDTAPVGLRADFSSHHKCRNFEKIQDWMVENTAIA